MKKNTFRTMGLVFFCVSLIFLLWGVWDCGYNSREFELKELLLNDNMEINSNPWLNQSRLTFRWQPKIKTGQVSQVILIITTNDGRLNTDVEKKLENIDGNSVIVTNHNPPTSNILAEANLDLSRFLIAPGSEIIAPLYPNQSVQFVWNIRADDAEHGEGMVWLHLRFASNQNEDHVRIPITAQQFEIKAVDFLGMTAPGTRVIGVYGIIFSLLMVLISFSRLSI